MKKLLCLAVLLLFPAISHAQTRGGGGGGGNMNNPGSPVNASGGAGGGSFGGGSAGVSQPSIAITRPIMASPPTAIPDLSNSPKFSPGAKP